MKTNYYDETYFDWQRNQGLFGGRKNRGTFAPYVQPTDCVLDFGCGGGYLLAQLDAAKRVGVEINDTARAEAVKNGVEAYKSVNDVPDSYCDVIISNHALEHVYTPYEILVGLKQKLKPGGRIVFVVPIEKKKKYDKNDINKHLYTWSEMNLGNLFDAAGFEVDTVNEIFHRWPPYYETIDKLFGNGVFNLLCRIYARLKPNLSQVKIVAHKA